MSVYTAFIGASSAMFTGTITTWYGAIVPVNIADEAQMKIATTMYETLKAAGIEVVLDDRDERAGVKFKDADLIGFPYRVTVGKTIADGLVEFKIREIGEIVKVEPNQAIELLIEKLTNI